MMMNIRKQRLAVAVAGTLSLMATTAQAAEFTASTTLQNTLAVTAISPLDIGTVFAASTGEAATDGLGVLNIPANGTATNNTGTSTAVSLRSLGTPVPAQGSVDSTSDFTLQLPDTSGYLASEWTEAAGTGATLVADFADGKAGTAATFMATKLTISADPEIPALYLLHFTLADVSGGEGALPASPVAANDGIYEVEMDFGETTYVFNVGATVVTQPGDGTALDYEEGTYSGTFEVTASY